MHDPIQTSQAGVSALFDVGEPVPPLFDSVVAPDEPKPKPVPDPTEPIQFYDPPLAGAEISPCGIFRYTLWRRFLERGPSILFIGLNPSTADATTDDATVRRLISFAKREHMARMTVVNLFAFRSTYPRDLMTAVDANGPDNFQYVVTQCRTTNKIVLCWGNGGSLRIGAHSHDAGHYMFTALLECLQLDFKPLCFGVTKRGHPKHPLRLRADTKIVQFDGYAK